MIIDIHNHPDWHGHNLDKFIANMDKYGIDKTWLLSWESPFDEYDPAFLNVLPPGCESGSAIPFSRCLSYVERKPDRFILGYCPDLREPDAIDRMKAAVYMYGARVCGELKLRMMYDNYDAIRFFKYCGEAGLPVILHLDYEFQSKYGFPRPNYWYGGGIDALERAIQKCPNTVFIGHAPGFWAHISGDDQYDKYAYPGGKVLPNGQIPVMLRKYPNLYCDISGFSGANALKRDPENAKSFLTEFKDRVMFGRDYFDNVHQEFLNSLGLPQNVLDAIYFGNALKLIPLDK